MTCMGWDKVKDIVEVEGTDGCLLKWELTQDSNGDWTWKWIRYPSSYPKIKPVTAQNYQAIQEKADEFEIPLTWALEKRSEYLNDVIARNEKLLIESSKRLAGSGGIYRGLLNQRVTDDSMDIKNAEFELRRLDPTWKPKKDGLTDEMIERAREYPIKMLLPNPVRHKMTLCCFHEDKYPSMYVNDVNDGNYVHCFSCNKGWNPIDFTMSTRGYDFKEAVKYLNEIN